MRRLLPALLLCGFMVPVLAMAQSAFDGTWKIDVNKAEFPKKPDVYLLQDGMYQCKSCVPPVDVKANGQDQKVTGHPYYDTTAVKVVNDHQIEETDKKGGKVVGTSSMTVSPDGNTLTFEFSDSSNSNAAPVTGKGEETRVAKGPAGANAISGSWRIAKMENVSDNAVTFTFKSNGDELSMTSPTGQSYTAKLNGPDAPYNGDPGTNSVSVKSMGKDTVEETDKRDGKVISVTKMTVAPGGNTMNIVSDDKLHGTTARFVATKQ